MFTLEDETIKYKEKSSKSDYQHQLRLQIIQSGLLRDVCRTPLKQNQKTNSEEDCEECDGRTTEGESNRQTGGADRQTGRQAALQGRLSPQGGSTHGAAPL